MIYDFNELMKEYGLCYADKSRIRFIEQYLSTFDATRGRKVPFNCFPRQRAFLKALSESRNVVAVKPRQCGITTLSSAWATGQCVFASKDAPETILCIANKLEQAQEILIKIRDFLEQVPRWMWGNEFFSPDPNSEKNSKSIFVKDAKGLIQLFNGCRIIARASGPNAARGISAVSVLIIDEAAFLEEGIAAYTTAAATMASNPNSKTVMVSTPNGRDELYYNTYRQALNHENSFTAVQFRWYQDPRFNKFLVWKKKDEKSGEWLYDEDPIVDEDGSVEYNEERWAKLERSGWKPTSPWYEDMCKLMNNDPMKIAQELDVSFLGSADNVVAPEYIEMQEKCNVMEPLEDFRDPIVEETWFWKKPIDGHRYILACLPEGEKVRTQRGLVNVQDVQKDDKLLTKDGKLVSIVHKMRRSVKDEKIVTFRPSNTCRKTTFTWNHPIVSSINTELKRKHGEKRYWDFNFTKNNAESVNVRDWLVVPNTYYLKELTEDEILDKWNKYKETTRVDFRIDCPLLNDDFWWYCGMWLAEGWVGKDKFNNLSLHTCHNISETHYIEKITNISASLFNRRATTSIQEKRNVAMLSVSSKELSNFMLDNFGKYAKNKHIAEWIKFLPRRFKIKLIEGYNQGDGFIHGRQKSSGFTSISLRLLEDVQDILFSLGIISSIKLHVKEGTIRRFPNREKVSVCSNKYELSLGLYDTKKLLELFGIENDIQLKNRRIIKDSFFSDDMTKIYFRVAEKEEKLYSGYVYNFWVDDNTHTYTCMNISCGNCDPSRGTAADRTAIEIIDMDGRDENGMPIIEQVAEYVGKKLGDDIGAICFQYATMYNDAFVVVDATGGQGDAAILAMLQMGYKNLYYEDMSQKNYMVQRSTKNYDGYTDKLPGFHFQGNRYPVLSNFAGLVRNNEFKIRSERVISELETWIFKGENARMDHQDGAHDDTITSLAMGLFVMQYTVNRIQNTIKKDKAILNAYMMNSTIGVSQKKDASKGMTPGNGLPFYNPQKMKSYNSSNFGSHMWLFGGLK